MKELLEFYNNCSKDLKDFILYHCKDYFDPNQPDGYRRPDCLEASTTDLFEKEFDEFGWDNEERTFLALTNLIKDDHELVKSLLTKPHRFLNRQKFINNSYSASLLHLTSDELREYQNNLISTKEYYPEKKRLSPTFFFLLNKDFSKAAMTEAFEQLMKLEENDDINIRNLYPLDNLIELFGADNVKKYMKKDIFNIPFYKITACKEYSDLFDELFFCEDGWSENDKKSYVENINIQSTKDFELFVKHILAVDMYYIKCLPEMFKYNMPLVNQLSSLKKPDEELTDGMSYEQKYRFERQFRLLLKALYACYAKKESKSRTKDLKEIAPILKLYNKDFDVIAEAMYPEIAA